MGKGGNTMTVSLKPCGVCLQPAYFIALKLLVRAHCHSNTTLMLRLLYQKLANFGTTEQ